MRPRLFLWQSPPFFFGWPTSFTGAAAGTKGRASELTAQDHVQLRQQGSQPMRSLTALAVVLAAATVSVPAALAQDTAPSTSDPSAGAQQPLPGEIGRAHVELQSLMRIS